jgi:hypothetical protein
MSRTFKFEIRNTSCIPNVKQQHIRIEVYQREEYQIIRISESFGLELTPCQARAGKELTREGIP